MMYKNLRQIYPEFTFSNYAWKFVGENLLIRYEFNISPNIVFTPRVLVRKAAAQASKLNSNTLDNLVFNLGLIEMISYWKATCSPVIRIKPHKLDNYQIDWWMDLIFAGMAEFFYKNRINYAEKDFLKIKSGNKPLLTNSFIKIGSEKVLIPVGGGKDSAVTLKLLSKEIALEKIGVFLLNPTPNILDIVKILKIDNVVRIDRQIDPTLLELNKKGFLNGHTPFSAYIAFASLLGSVVFGYKYLALSNESSSNEGNVKYLGKTVNHQYSKSIVFESKFREYNKKYLSNIEYFSFLRPLNELQIAKLFSTLSDFFGNIKSCNIDRNTKIWCGRCAKCLSIYILLDPFLTGEQLRSIYYDDLFTNTNLVELMDSLVMKDKIKPFECVATKKEIKTAIMMSIIKRQQEDELPPLLKIAKDKYFRQDVKEFDKNMLLDWGKENYLPDKFAQILKEYVS